MQKEVGNRQKEKESADEIKLMHERMLTQQNLASLGMLAAGIVHEIKTPLNFIYNFAKISIETLQELQQMLQDPQQHPPSEIKELMASIQMNLEKVCTHTKKAELIIHGILTKARSTPGEMLPINVKDLLEEASSLSYHAMRAQDTSFNITLLKEYDDKIQTVPLIEQNISRALLNLLNNAYYSTHQKKKQQGEAYDPVVAIKTRKLDSWLEITIRDNGGGIPLKIQDKVGTPFFTTKPLSQGTGLGISLAKEIIEMEHRGKLQMNTVEGEFAEFIILLPLSQIKNV